MMIFWGKWYGQLLFCMLFVLTLSCALQKTYIISAQKYEDVYGKLGEILKVDPNPTNGFYWPYYLYIPPTISKKLDKKIWMLVCPNNSGRSDDDLCFHAYSAYRWLESHKTFADELQTVLLVPIFPRLKSQGRWKYYTHALDRDTILIPNGPLRRIDEQLICMVNDARHKLRDLKLILEPQICMIGFSASAQFVNRFSVLHPGIVKAAVIGGAGGYMVPVPVWKGKTLQYPLGTFDYATITGRAFETRQFNHIAFYMFTGANDQNDPVRYRDGYEKEDEKIIFTIFGKDLHSRFLKVEEVFKAVGNISQFQVYDNVGHQITKKMESDMKKFLANTLSKR